MSGEAWRELLELTPPHNIEAERAVLGALILEPADTTARLARTLRPEDFFKEHHGRIFEAAARVAEAGGAPDLIALAAELRRSEALEEIGGPAMLAGLADAGASATNLGQYVALIQEAAAKREAIRAASDLMHHAYNGIRLPELAAKAAALGEELRSRVAIASPAALPEALGAVLDQVVTDLEAGPRTTIRTPFPTLNTLLSGGFLRGELVYLGGRPGFGKTALGLYVARHAAEQGHPALVVSREMLVTALGRRVLTQVTRVHATALRAGILDADEWARLDAALPRLRALPVWLTDRAVSIGQVEATIRAAQERHGVRLVVVDYLQLLRAPRSITEKRLAVEFVSQTLKTLAVELGLVVVCLSSLSRPERGVARPPHLSDLRESGALEHDADVVLLLHRPEPGQPDTQLIVAKGRDVATGTVELLFDGPTLHFAERSVRAEVPA
jgi:replicative DNA helicase